jgi:hypothetical protein
MMLSALVLGLGLALAQDAPTAAPPPPAATEPEPPAEVGSTTAITGMLTLRVNDREAAIQQAIADAEAAGGWFQSLGKDHVSLRIPVDSARGFLESQRRHGDLLDRSYSAQDLGSQMRDLEGLIAARRDVLLKYLSVLDSASPKAVVSVEREVTRVVQQIEHAEGQLRVLRDRADYARIDLHFRFRERRAPRRDGSSSFAWLNTMNVGDMVDDLRRGRRATRSRATVPVPEGFAPWRKRGRFQAVSPDGVSVRVRSAKNKPRAELGFWEEALKSRMVDAGYRVIHEERLATSGGPGALLELGAAAGEADQTYLVVVFVDGRHLIIAEATGEAETFRARREAVLAAFKETQL